MFGVISRRRPNMKGENDESNYLFYHDVDEMYSANQIAYNWSCDRSWNWVRRWPEQISCHNNCKTSDDIGEYFVSTVNQSKIKDKDDWA